ncbi:hypothetical protein [uncultured Nostoc sp.]
MQFLIRLLSFPNEQEKQDWKSSHKAEIAAIAQIILYQAIAAIILPD